MLLCPFSYPGGKFKVANLIATHIIKNCQFKEFVEPFVGGGSVFLAVKQKIPFFEKKRFIINDFNIDVYTFWKVLKEQNEKLCKEIIYLRNNVDREKGKEFQLQLMKTYSDVELDRAVSFYILRQINFGSLMSEKSFSVSRFRDFCSYPDEKINRLRKYEKILEDVEIYNLDYKDVLKEKFNQPFFFLDPPYPSVKNYKLYGKEGEFHINFDIEDFASFIKKFNSKWFITLDNTEENKKLFNFAYIREYKMSYRLALKNVYELFITNYPYNL